MPGLYIQSQPAVALEMWQAQIDALPPKKRASWKASTKDVRGARHCVRFHNGYFQVKCTPTLLGASAPPIDGWAPIIATGSRPDEEQLQDSYGHILPRGVPKLQMVTNETAQLREASEGCGLEGLELEFFRAMLIGNMIDANRTGNHHRNHKVIVPTAAGQPVRG